MGKLKADCTPEEWEKLLETERKYRAANREKVRKKEREKKRKYREANREKYNMYQRIFTRKKAESKKFLMMAGAGTNLSKI